MAELREYGPLVLRVFLGLLFLIAGIMKLGKFDGIVGMVAGLPVFGLVPTLFAALLIASEIVGGAMLIAGFWTKWAVWPLVVVMAVATVFMVLPGFLKSPGNATGLLFHLLAIAGLVSLFLTGPGAYAAQKSA